MTAATSCGKLVDLGVTDYSTGNALRPFMPCALPAGHDGPCEWSKDEPSAANEQRLHGKYHGLRRTSDNSEVEGWYFVIREDDLAGEVALLAYADACEGYAPELAADLRKHVEDERLVRGLYEAGWER